MAEEAAYPDLEYEFFDCVSCVRRWIPSWASLFLIGAGRGLFSQGQWDLLIGVWVIVSYSSSLQRIAEQIIDIPVPQGRGDRGGGGGLQGLRPGQNSTALGGADLVDIPVPHGGGLHGPGSTASSSHSPGAVDEAFTCFFSNFSPKSKKCAVGSALGVGTGLLTPWRYELETELESELEEDAGLVLHPGGRRSRGQQ